MKKIITKYFFCCIVVLVVALLTIQSADCEDIITTIGDSWVNTNQDMATEIDTIMIINGTNFLSAGDQSIIGQGIGDSVLSVFGYGYLGQEDLYLEEVSVPNGIVIFSGNSVMETLGEAGTDPIDQVFDIDLTANRESNTDIVINPNDMNASLISSGYFSADITGATGTTNFGVNLDTIDQYLSTSVLGDKIMTGQTRITIVGGSF